MLGFPENGMRVGKTPLRINEGMFSVYKWDEEVGKWKWGYKDVLELVEETKKEIDGLPIGTAWIFVFSHDSKL